MPTRSSSRDVSLKTSKSFDDAAWTSRPRRSFSSDRDSDHRQRRPAESDADSASSSWSKEGTSRYHTPARERLSSNQLSDGRGFPPKQQSPNKLHRPSMQNGMTQHSNEGIVDIEDLKERLCISNKKNLKNKPRRRLSLSSHFSGSSGPSGELSSSPLKYLRSPGGEHSDNQSLTAGDIFLDLQTPGLPYVDMEETAAPKMPHRHSGGGEYNMSASSTIPIGNVVKTDREKKRRSQIKKDQMIESIVWFSFHIPRTVLEDLIAFELEVWRRNSSRQSKRKDARRSRRAPAEEEPDSEVSVSSLSDDGGGGLKGKGVAQHLVRRTSSGLSPPQPAFKTTELIRLPKAYERESAILFVDMSGFTKLSTLLDVESLSKVINSYFDLIVSEVILYGGDILKFAGDAFFAEWRVTEDTDMLDCEKVARNPLSDLNASLVSINEMNFDDFDIPPLSSCVMMAAKCATSIVKKFSDYHVTTADGRSTNHTNNINSEAMLNVHCGVGVGRLVGLHVRDCKDDGPDEDGMAEEMRREFLLLGDPIDQVSQAADRAKGGEAMASPEALLALAVCCELTDEQRLAEEPICIASRDESFLNFDEFVDKEPVSGAAMQPYESLRMHCTALSEESLYRLNLQMALYVHPVIRADELALSSAIQSGKISQPTETLESRHRAEAELRSVFTLFISAMVSPRITGNQGKDQELYEKLADIMWITSRELDRYSGHLRQFIVDDKGMWLLFWVCRSIKPCFELIRP
jgi:class 3 adenylate cyclase